MSIENPGQVDRSGGGFSALERLAAWWARFDAQTLGLKLNGEPSPEQAKERLDKLGPQIREANVILTALQKMQQETLKRLETLSQVKLQAEKVIHVAIPVGHNAKERFMALVPTLHPIQLDSLLARLEKLQQKGDQTDVPAA